MKTLNRNYDYYEHTKINNLDELLKLTIKKYSHEIAFSYLKNNVKIKKTYNAVYRDVSKLKNYFQEKYHHKHIAIIGENSYNWIITFLAIILSDNVCVVMDKDIELDNLVNLMKKTNTKIICYSKNYDGFVGDMAYKSLALESILDLDAKKKQVKKMQYDNDKDAVIFFTSGTTGANKAVVLSQKNMATDIYAASSLFKLSGNVVALLPFHHAFGLVTSVLKPFYYGKEVFLNSSLKYVLRDLKENKPDTLFVVPAFVETFYNQIWKMARQKHQDKILKYSLKVNNCLLKINVDLRRKLFQSILKEFGGNLHYIICGGAPLDKKYVKWFRSIGIEILNGYGITECSPVVSVNRNHFYKDGSVGQICRDVNVKIIDNEICISGDIIMKGYYKDKKSTNEVIKDGYFHTGDLGYLDSEGFLFITGRKKNIIILSNGENISPEEIESELRQNKGIAEVIVYEDSNHLVASIYPTEDYLNNQEYFDHLIYKYNQNKPKNHQIAFVKLRTKEFIKNNNGKILRNKVEEGK